MCTVTDDSPSLGFRIFFVLLALSVIVWTYRRVGNVGAIRREFHRRFGVNVSKRFVVGWFALSIAASLGVIAFLVLYLAGKTG